MPKQKVRAVLDVMIEVDAPTPQYAVSDVEQLKDVELNIAYATPGVRLVIMTASVRTGMHSDDAPRIIDGSE